MDQDNNNNSSNSSSSSNDSSSMDTDDYEMDDIPSIKRVYDSEDLEDSFHLPEIVSRAKRRRLQQPPAMVEGELDQTMAAW